MLEQIEDGDAIAPLARCLTDKKLTPEIGVRAAAALLALDADHAGGRAHLVAALDHRKLPVRGLAVEQLERVGGAWAEEPLARLAGRWRGRELTEAIAQARAAIAARGGAA